MVFVWVVVLPGCRLSGIPTFLFKKKKSKMLKQSFSEWSFWVVFKAGHPIKNFYGQLIEHLSWVCTNVDFPNKILGQISVCRFIVFRY